MIIVCFFVIAFGLLFAIWIGLRRWLNKGAYSFNQKYNGYEMLGKSYDSLVSELGKPVNRTRKADGTFHCEWRISDGPNSVSLAGTFDSNGICIEETNGGIDINYV